jgi:hypothetical protein
MGRTLPHYYSGPTTIALSQVFFINQLLELHRGKFGQINLDLVYPFLNALGLLTLLITGVLMWLQSPKRKYKQMR